MEQLLRKMARQLDGLDEASLLALWEKYASIVARFEPSKRWEEAALVLSLIQAKHWKNQLFNHNWAARSRPNAEGFSPPQFTLEMQPDDVALPKNKKASVLPFKLKSGEPLATKEMDSEQKED